MQRPMLLSSLVLSTSMVFGQGATFRLDLIEPAATVVQTPAGATATISIPPGVSSVPLKVAMVIVPDPPGIDEWAVSVVTDPSFGILDATTRGTAGDLNLRGGLRDSEGSFEWTEVVMREPGTGNCAHGATSAVVLSFTKRILLDRAAGETALLLSGSMDVSRLATGQQLPPCRLRLLPGSETGLRGSGEPVQTAATSLGEAVSLRLQSLDIIVGRGPTTPAAASACGNVNGDAHLDISDATYLLQYLFSGGSAPRCGASSGVPAGFLPLGRNAQGYDEYRHERTGMVFVRLPGGSYSMGSPSSEAVQPWEQQWVQAYEQPIHLATVSPFLIGKHEVTQPQWAVIMGTNPSRNPGASLPVDSVSWEQARNFCRCAGFRLPTEAEWEYACRGGSTGPYGGGVDLGLVGWFDENAGGTTHPAGQKAANAFGLQDMHGNVAEWCEDTLAQLWYGRPEALWLDPLCTLGSESRVVRGGSWGAAARMCRSAARNGLSPDTARGDMGFRAVVTLDPPARCDDPNGNGTLDISDAVYLLAYLFLGGPPPRCEG